MAEKTRFDRLLSNRGYCSRKEAKLFLKNFDCKEGEIPIKSVSDQIDPTHVTIDGIPIDPPPGMLIMLYKPEDYVCSHREHGRLIYDLLPERFSRRDPPLSSVGRLDKDATGLILLTDDGQINHRLTSPKHHVAKIYEVTLEAPLQGGEAELFRQGTLVLEGEDTPLLPAIFVQTSEHSGTLTIHEGRYHQIKRMFAAVGNKVIKLHRIKIGCLNLTGLEMGQWRFLTDAERGLLVTQ